MRQTLTVAAIVLALFALSYFGMRAITGRDLPDWALVLPLIVIGADIGWVLTRRTLRRPGDT